MVKLNVNETDHSFDAALDTGLVVNPAVFGTSIVRSGEITAKNDVIEQSNFSDHLVTRFNEIPRQTNAYILESAAPPAVGGEPGVPPFGPATRSLPQLARVSAIYRFRAIRLLHSAC
jgi:CO/xanthine dehydrogenase Mo-binding subunit